MYKNIYLSQAGGQDGRQAGWQAGRQAVWIPSVDDPDVAADLDVLLELIRFELHDLIGEFLHEGPDVHGRVRI